MKASREIHHNCWWLWLLFLPLLMLVQHQRPVLAAESDTVLQRSSKTTTPEVNINGPYKFGIATGYELFATEKIETTSNFRVNTLATDTFKAVSAESSADNGFVRLGLLTRQLEVSKTFEYQVGRPGSTIMPRMIIKEGLTENDVKLPEFSPAGFKTEEGTNKAPNFSEYGYVADESMNSKKTTKYLQEVSDYYADQEKIAESGFDVEKVVVNKDSSEHYKIDVSQMNLQGNLVIYMQMDNSIEGGDITITGIKNIDEFNKIKAVIFNFSNAFTLRKDGIKLRFTESNETVSLDKVNQKENEKVLQAAEKFIMNFKDITKQITYDGAHVGRTIAPTATVRLNTQFVGWPKIASKIIDFENPIGDYTEIPETVEPIPDPENPGKPEDPEDSNTVEEAVAYLKPASGQEPDEKIDLTKGTPAMDNLIVNQDVNYEIKWQNEKYKLFYRSGDNGAWQPLTSGGTTHYVGSDKLDKLVVTPANNDATKIVVADLPYDADQKFTFAPEAQKIQFALTQAEEPGAGDWHSEWLTLQPGKFEMIVPRLRFGTHKIPEAGQTTKVTAKDAKIQVSDTLKPFFTLSAKINSDRTSVLTEPRNLRAHRQDNLVRYFPSDQPDSSLVFCLMQQDYSFDGDFVFEIKSTYTPTEHRAKIIWTLTTTFNGSKGVIPAAA